MDASCESCGQPATVQLEDGSVWCGPCDRAAQNLGYDDGEPIHVAPPVGELLCWSCGLPLAEGEDRNKNGWLVHQLCPVPVATP